MLHYEMARCKSRDFVGADRDEMITRDPTTLLSPNGFSASLLPAGRQKVQLDPESE
jgi:hypothetical protein